jgi:cellobiose phosphorylase
VTYQITVERAGSGNAVSLEVNGKPVDGDIVPFPPAGTQGVQVKAVLR